MFAWSRKVTTAMPSSASEHRTTPNEPDNEGAPARDPARDAVVYPIKRTKGKSFLFDFLDQNLKSEQFRKLLEEGK
jgi:hypothetical protein